MKKYSFVILAICICLLAPTRIWATNSEVGTEVPTKHTIAIETDHASAEYLDYTVQGISTAYPVPRFSEPRFQLRADTCYKVKRVLLDQVDITRKMSADGIIQLERVCKDQELTIQCEPYHVWSDWSSVGNDQHTRVCTSENCDETETKSCHGGTASYFKKAVCTDCNGVYGSLLIDVIPPTGEIKIKENIWNTLINTITFDLFCKETQRVTITATDDSVSHEGYTAAHAVKQAYYLYQGNQALTSADLDELTFTETTDSFNVNPDNRYVVYAKLIDHAGNKTYLSSDGIVLDATLPGIKGIADGKVYCPGAVFTVEDDYIDTVKDGSTVMTANEDGTYSLSPGTHTITATDKAGNSETIMVGVLESHVWDTWASDGKGRHVRRCTRPGCDETEAENCNGGTATCNQRPICLKCEESYGEIDETKHLHVDFVAEKLATVDEVGNISYWHCLDCGKYYADSNLTREITLADTVIEKLSTPTPTPSTTPEPTPSATPEPTPSTTPEPTPSITPSDQATKTGDSSNLLIWFMVSVLCMITVAGTYWYKKQIKRS